MYAYILGNCEIRWCDCGCGFILNYIFFPITLFLKQDETRNESFSVTNFFCPRMIVQASLQTHVVIENAMLAFPRWRGVYSILITKLVFVEKETITIFY